MATTAQFDQMVDVDADIDLPMASGACVPRDDAARYSVFVAVHRFTARKNGILDC